MIFKLPQIYKIIKHKSVHGISKFLFYIEFFMYIHSSSYSMHYHIPFSVYGENLIILAQNIVIVILFWKFNEEIKLPEKIGFFLFFIAYSYLLFSDAYLTDLQWDHI